MPMTPTTDAAFTQDVLASPIPVLVEFTAAWCPPCHAIAPVLDRIADEQAGRLTVLSLDVDQQPQTAMTYGVLAMPTLALFVDGKVVSQTVGVRPRAQIMATLEPHLGAPAA